MKCLFIAILILPALTIQAFAIDSRIAGKKFLNETRCGPATCKRSETFGEDGFVLSYSNNVPGPDKHPYRVEGDWIIIRKETDTGVYHTLYEISQNGRKIRLKDGGPDVTKNPLFILSLEGTDANQDDPRDPNSFLLADTRFSVRKTVRGQPCEEYVSFDLDGVGTYQNTCQLVSPYQAPYEVSGNTVWLNKMEFAVSSRGQKIARAGRVMTKIGYDTGNLGDIELVAGKSYSDYFFCIWNQPEKGLCNVTFAFGSDGSMLETTNTYRGVEKKSHRFYVAGRKIHFLSQEHDFEMFLSDDGRFITKTVNGPFLLDGDAANKELLRLFRRSFESPSVGGYLFRDPLTVVWSDASGVFRGPVFGYRVERDKVILTKNGKDDRVLTLSKEDTVLTDADGQVFVYKTPERN